MEDHPIGDHQVEVHWKTIWTETHLPTVRIIIVGEVTQDTTRHLIVMIRNPQRVH